MNIEYQQLMKEFIFFLETTGIAPSTIVREHRHLKEFLLYIEEQGANSIKDINNSHLQSFILYLHKRKNR